VRVAHVILIVSAASLAAAGARAQPLVLPQDKPAPYDAYNSPRIEQPWVNQVPDSRLAEKPIGEVLRARLGMADGSAELFRYEEIDGDPSNHAVLDGAVSGGGIQLKLSW